MRLIIRLIILLELLILPVHLTYANHHLKDSQNAFIVKWIDAINSKDVKRIKSLVHPDCLSLINQNNKAFFDYILNENIGKMVPSRYDVDIKETIIPEDQEGLFNGIVTLPIKPTHIIELNYVINKKENVDILRYIAQKGNEWYIVIPIPTESGIEQFNSMVNKK